MDYNGELESSHSKAGPESGAACREFRIYRSTGALSVIYFASFASDAKALFEAEKIAQFGYQIDVWREGTRTFRVCSPNVVDNEMLLRAPES